MWVRWGLGGCEGGWALVVVGTSATSFMVREEAAARAGGKYRNYMQYGDIACSGACVRSPTPLKPY